MTDSYEHLTDTHLIRAAFVTSRIARWGIVLTVLSLVGSVWLDARWLIMALIVAVVTVVAGYTATEAHKELYRRYPKAFRADQ